jgi:hypothetical protein
MKRQRKEIVAKEQEGVASALERCCELAKELCARLREKEPGTLDRGSGSVSRSPRMRFAGIGSSRGKHRKEAGHRLLQSSSASRRTAGAFGFLNLRQSGERPDR